MTTSAAPRAAARPVVRRGGWALPPLPPESWIGGPWTVGLLGLLGVSLLVPLAMMVRDDADVGLALAGMQALTAAAGALAAYLLLVQESVTGDRRLRWVAAGFGMVVPVVLVRTALLHGPDGALSDSSAELSRGAALALVLQLVVPVAVLTAGYAHRSLRLVAWPVSGLLVLMALALVCPGPLGRLVEADGGYTPGLRAASLVVAAVAGAAAVSWWRSGASGWRGPWAVVLAGLAIAPVASVARALVSERFDAAWWASAVALDAALVVPAVGLLVQGTNGYFRQAHRWHQLEAEVRALRTATALLPGRSVVPEDESGLPEEPEVLRLVQERRLKIALQAVVELATGRVVGYEALSRFGGRTPTDRWFRAARRHGLGGELEEVTLTAALALLPRLPASQFLAVNVSPPALADPVVLGLLHGADLSRVVVEITEHEAVADYPSARAALDRLRADGARIAVDDTGAGFASLRHVLLLQPDVIKLDTSITRDVQTDARQQALVQALLSFADEVGSEVLAEGVETEAQQRALVEIGVPIGQGWHLGLPEVQEP